MKTIAISGATGLVGSALEKLLSEEGHSIRRLVRRTPRAETEIQAECEVGPIDVASMDGLDAVIHLAGESIAAGRWTTSRKARIRDSRVIATRRLCEALSQTKQPPRILVAASAIGFYGDRGTERLTEDSAPGSGFLPEVCQAWERATEPAVACGIRVINLRIGVVLAKSGGALAKMLTPFRFGLGGKIGSGRQYWSWISLIDLVGIIRHALDDEQLVGPINAVSPQAVTNLEFTRTLGRVLHRPTILPLPGFAARLMFGEMAGELLLASQHVIPQRLLAGGFAFRFESLEDALRAELA